MSDTSLLIVENYPPLHDDTRFILRNNNPRFLRRRLDDVTREAVVVADYKVGGTYVDDVDFRGSGGTYAEAFKMAAQAAIDTIFVRPIRRVADDAPTSRAPPKSPQPPSKFPWRFYPDGMENALRREPRTPEEEDAPPRQSSPPPPGDSPRVLPPSSQRNGSSANANASPPDAGNRERLSSSNPRPPPRPVTIHDSNSSAPKTPSVQPASKARAASKRSVAPPASARNVGNTQSEARAIASLATQSRRKRKSRLLSSQPAPSANAASQNELRSAPPPPTLHSAPLQTASPSLLPSPAPRKAPSANARRTESNIVQPPSNEPPSSNRRQAASSERKAPPTPSKRNPKLTVLRKAPFNKTQVRPPASSKEEASSSKALARRKSNPPAATSRPVEKQRTGSAQRERPTSTTLPPRSRINPSTKRANRRKSTRPSAGGDSKGGEVKKVTKKRSKPKQGRRTEIVEEPEARPRNARKRRKRQTAAGFSMQPEDLPAVPRKALDPAAPREDPFSLNERFKQVHGGQTEEPKEEPVLEDLVVLQNTLRANCGADAVTEIRRASRLKRRNGVPDKAGVHGVSNMSIDGDKAKEVLDDLKRQNVIKWDIRPTIGGLAANDVVLYGFEVTVDFTRGKGKDKFWTAASGTTMEEARANAFVGAIGKLQTRIVTLRDILGKA